MTNAPGILRVYVDETGDRGLASNSSQFFAFAAVLIPDEDEPQLRAMMSQLRSDLSVPQGKALHWNKHVKTWPRRQHVAASLGKHATLRIIYVIMEKSAIRQHSGLIDHAIFYNYAAGFVMERALLAARDWPGGQRHVIIRFGHVRGFDHSSTNHYFTRRASFEKWVPWHLLHGNAHFSDQAAWDGLQAADQYAGMLSAACRPDEFGGYEAAHLLNIRHQIRRNGNGSAIGWGFKCLGSTASFTALPWWPTKGI